jgi:hypothetical protein
LNTTIPKEDGDIIVLGLKELEKIYSLYHGVESKEEQVV